ncbi:ADP-ribosylation factor-like protein 3 [Anneissia japonica]|uniref:ADP-ribosylation factor-like protein 3 n=1 Tax=Anneissia japonica TaxID=1529436 RepID=UPI00142568E1|nr:ADP-ribosylation factor-like protein 3 [Anneissia japonica]
MAFNSWFRDLSFFRKTAVILGTGALVAGATYSVFEIQRRRNLACGGINMESLKNIEDIEEGEKRILVLGLDGAGKSTLLGCLNSLQAPDDTKPTEGFNVMCIQTESVTLNIWEVGGTENVRSYWSNFIQGTQVLMFVVDASDKERLGEAKTELQKLITDKRLKNVPLILVANKQDKEGAMSVDNLQRVLELNLGDRAIYPLETQVPIGGEVQGVNKVKELLEMLPKS